MNGSSVVWLSRNGLSDEVTTEVVVLSESLDMVSGRYWQEAKSDDEVCM